MEIYFSLITAIKPRLRAKVLPKNMKNKSPSVISVRKEGIKKIAPQEI
tara:strand:- start:1182 stop:1325 length:144 start_codon:yes stop_codon:yes gene_type:complete